MESNDLNNKDLCRRWGVSVWTLIRLRKRGVLKFYRAGNGIRYRLADVKKCENRDDTASKNK